MELIAKNPIDLTNIKLETSSDKGLYYKVRDGRNKKIYPSLPGIVIKLDDDKIVISHRNRINDDYITIYEFDGDKKVRVNQEVSESTLLGETKTDLKFNVKLHGSNYGASNFIGKTFRVESKKRSYSDRAECIARSIITLPFKSFGYHDEYCRGKKIKPEDESEKLIDLDTPNKEDKKEKWEFKNFNDNELYNDNKLDNDNKIKIESEIKRINDLIL